MNLKQKLKRNARMRRFVKALKIYREFLTDANDFRRNYLESAERTHPHPYRAMLLIHSLEKGLCSDFPRPFGQQKAANLKRILTSMQVEAKNDFTFNLGISVLSEWVHYYENMNWSDPVAKEIKAWLVDYPNSSIAGAMTLSAPVLDEKSMFSDVISSRHSIRTFDPRPLNPDDIEFALDCFTHAPSACNRQMCKVYEVQNSTLRNLIADTIYGMSGFNRNSANLFVITFDLAALEFFGERHQGYLNAGLAAMNFANGLHARGIGSCFMQWSNKRSEDRMVRNSLKLSASERIAVVLAAGYYPATSHIPKSCRRPLSEIYQIIE